MMETRRRWIISFLTICVLSCLMLSAYAFSAETETESRSALPKEGKQEAGGTDEADMAEWTVMWYLCGTDLESAGGMASVNLEMISKTIPDSKVNLLIETGGAKSWQAEEKVGIDIASDRLQRWRYSEDGFTLEDEQISANMARYSTLSDFIRWGAENYPAKKNMLVLWDHGGGSSSGLIVDELYDEALMSLDGLEQALKSAGTHFDLVMTDACLMASLETAQAVQPYADYFLASEEMLPGQGTNYTEWMQAMYDEPECDVVRVGKNVCNATQIMYAEQDYSTEINGLTFSLIDLSRIGMVAEAFESFMKEAVGLLNDPVAFGTYVNAVSNTERYSFRTMWDLYDLARRAMRGGISKETALKLENAVDDAVVFNIRGSYHPYSHGLSVYLCYNGDRAELDRLVRNCRNPWQLAYLDAVCSRWDAPAWVTEIVGEIPQLEPEYYTAKFETQIPEDQSVPVLHLYSGVSTGGYLRYELQRCDDDLQFWHMLGESDDVKILDINEEEVTFAANFTGKWPAVDGMFLSVSSKEQQGQKVLMNALINIPDWGNREMNLRIIADYSDLYQPDQEESAEEAVDVATEETVESSEEISAEETWESVLEEEQEEREVKYEVAGFWDGYDSSTGLPRRNTWPLTMMKGIGMEICVPVYIDYTNSVGDMRYYDTFTLDSSLEVRDTVLPAGRYRLRYLIRDMLDKTYKSDFIYLTWDGEQAVFEDPYALEEQTEEQMEEQEAA